MIHFGFLQQRSVDIFCNPKPRMVYEFKNIPFTGEVKVSDYTRALFENGELVKIHNTKGTILLRLQKPSDWSTCLMVNGVLVGIDQAIKVGILSKEKLLYYKLKGDL